MMRKKISSISVAAAMVAISNSGYSTAAEMEEMVVTAQKRAESLENVPISITALTSDALDNAGVSNLRDLQNIVPAMRIDQQGAFSQPTIRGVGSSTAGAGMMSNIATYVDGFYVPSQLGTSMDFLNVASVQVLKGPQGTLFGRNATGGAILVETRKPSFEPALEAQASIARFNKREFKVYGSSGVSDTVAIDLSAVVSSGDGFVENILTGADDDGQFDRKSYRASVVYLPTDTLSFRLAYAYSDIDDPLTNLRGAWKGNTTAYDRPGVVIPDGYREHDSDSPVYFRSTGQSTYLTVEKDFENVTLKSYTMKASEDSKSAQDADSTNIRLGYASFSPENETFTQELNLAGKRDRLDWIVGAFYMGYTENFYDLISNGVQFYRKNENDIDSHAFFADATYQLTDRLYLTGGLRYSKESATAYVDSALPTLNLPKWSSDWSDTTPRVVLRYELDDRSNVYFSYSEGFRAGTLNPASFNTTPVKPENIKAYEVGYKLKTDDSRFDAAIYSYDYKDMQVSSYLDGQSLVTNAASSSIDGAEIQYSLLFGDAWQLSLGAAYTDATYDDFPGSQARNLMKGTPGYLQIIPTSDASGKQLLRSPKYTGNMGLQYETPITYGTLRVNANLFVTDAFYFDSNEQVKQGAYELLNLRATWTSPDDHFSVAAYLNNATDREYLTQVLLVQQSAQQGYGEPRSFGVTVGYKY